MSKISLILETSFAPFQVLLANEERILFHSSEHEWDDNRRNIARMVNTGLQHIEATIKDIGMVFVNIGPGSTNAIRSGVSFANGLAYSLNIPVVPYTSFELMGYEVQQATQLPVLCTAKAINGNMYAGLYDANKVHLMQYGRLEDVVKVVAPKKTKFAVAGIRRDEVVQSFEATPPLDSETERMDAKHILGIQSWILERQTLPPAFVSPLNEQSKIFS